LSFETVSCAPTLSATARCNLIHRKTRSAHIRQCRLHGVNIESRIPPIPKSQRSNSLKPQTKKATGNATCHPRKSQLSRSKSRNLKNIANKNQPKKNQNSKSQLKKKMGYWGKLKWVNPNSLLDNLL
jgi:hypothetical protein